MPGAAAAPSQIAKAHPHWGWRSHQGYRLTRASSPQRGYKRSFRGQCLAAAAAVAFLLSAAAAPGQAQGPQAATIDSSLAVKLRPTGGLPKIRARASVLLLAGGNGVLNLNATGDTRDLQGNFLIRSARAFLFRGLNVAMLDAEPAFPAPSGLTNQRLTPEHAEHLGNVIAAVRKTWPGKRVWLVGTSNGTLSAFNAAARLTGPPVVNTEGTVALKGGIVGPLPREEAVPDGLVLTSSVTQPDPNGEMGTVLGQDPSLASITKPTLVMWHQNDSCFATPAAPAMSVFNGLTNVPAAKKTTAIITAGRPNIAVHACSAFGPHGYNGAEDQAVGAIAAFIFMHSQP
jgi:pimeloyl-ACP methyl ester carboxylesterase